MSLYQNQIQLDVIVWNFLNFIIIFYYLIFVMHNNISPDKQLMFLFYLCAFCCIIKLYVKLICYNLFDLSHKLDIDID